MGIVGLILVEKGFWDVVEQWGGVVEQLRVVLELFFLGTKSICPLNYLEWSSK
jgi:hypothetical protein